MQFWADIQSPQRMKQTDPCTFPKVQPLGWYLSVLCVGMFTIQVYLSGVAIFSDWVLLHQNHHKRREWFVSKMQNVSYEAQENW